MSLLLGRDRDVAGVREIGSGAEALAVIRQARPDLAFLDVEMPELDGFDVLELLGTELPAALVFVTAYEIQALRAFDAAA